MKFGDRVRRTADIQSLVPGERVYPYGRLGVELEWEGIGPEWYAKMSELKYWAPHDEASLKEKGIELALRTPLGGKDLEDAIEEVTSQGAKPDLTYRTSTHIHVDVRDFTLENFRVFMMWMAMLEPIVMAVYPERASNNFCTPMSRTANVLTIPSKYGIVDRGMSDMRRIDSILRSFNRETRYCSLNLHSIQKFGSIEFRMLPGISDKEELMFWCNLLLVIRNDALAREETDSDHLQALIDGMSGCSFGDLVHRHLNHPDFDTSFIDEKVETRALILDGMRAAQFFLHSSTSADIFYEKAFEYRGEMFPLVGPPRPKNPFDQGFPVGDPFANDEGEMDDEEFIDDEQEAEDW